jgi:aconitate decarboxylase
MVSMAHLDNRHITSTTGSIGAAVAVGRLLNLDVPSMQHAIGIAATQVTGLREMFGSHTKSFHPGRAAQNGLLAALFASNGYTSSLQALEAKRGWANVVSTTNNLDEYISTLGEVWEIQKNSFKPFPCGIVIHPIIDGCVQLRKDLRDQGLAAEDIERIDVRVHHLVLELTGKKTPKDGLEAKFSVYHGGAVGIVCGKATPAQYEDDVVTGKDVVSVRDKIDAKADEKVKADECFITVTFSGGKVLEKHVEHAVGSLEVPMTKELLKEKFTDQCMAALGEEGAKKANEAAWALESVRDMKELVSCL